MITRVQQAIELQLQLEVLQGRLHEIVQAMTEPQQATWKRWQEHRERAIRGEG